MGPHARISEARGSHFEASRGGRHSKLACSSHSKLARGSHSKHARGSHSKRARGRHIAAFMHVAATQLACGCHSNCELQPHGGVPRWPPRSILPRRPPFCTQQPLHSCCFVVGASVACEAVCAQHIYGCPRTEHAYKHMPKHLTRMRSLHGTAARAQRIGGRGGSQCCWQPPARHNTQHTTHSAQHTTHNTHTHIPLCTINNVLCILSFVLCAMYYVLCTLNFVLCALYYVL